MKVLITILFLCLGFCENFQATCAINTGNTAALPMHATALPVLTASMMEVKEAQKAESTNLKRLSRQRLLLIVTGFFALLLISLVVLLAVINKKRTKINKLLEKQKQEIGLVNKELAEKNRLITDQNKKITKSNQILSEVYDEHKTLVSVVAHDLKSPLNKIQGLVHILEMVGGLNSEQKELVAKIHQIVEGGRGLISDLNSLIYFEDNEVRADFEKVKLDEFITEVIKEHEAYAWKKSINLEFDDADCSFNITTDTKFLGRILDNLLSNAIKFSPQETTVNVSCYLEKGTFGIKVRDEGPGMLEEDMEQLYKKFKKLSAKPTGGESSTGLGLSIVKTLVLKLQGDIYVDSVPGKGTCFTVVFPVTQEKTAEGKEDAAKKNKISK